MGPIAFGVAVIWGVGTGVEVGGMGVGGSGGTVGVGVIGVAVGSGVDVGSVEVVVGG